MFAKLISSIVERFSDIFGLKPVIAIRFNRIGWYFIAPKDLKDTGKYWGLSLKLAQKKGKKFAQFFGEKVKGNNNEVVEEFYDDERDVESEPSL